MKVEESPCTLSEHEMAVDEAPPEMEDHDHVPKESFSPYMLIFTAYLALSCVVYNFDLAFGGLLLVMVPYQRDFGACTTTVAADGTSVQTCTLSAVQQSLISVTILFISVGSAIGSPLGTLFGRRRTIQIGSIITAIGAGGMLGTAGSFTNYMVCKCIQGAGLGLTFAAAPIYGIECVAAGHRGMIMALLAIGLGFGNMLGGAVALGSSKNPGRIAWQAPIICQIPLALLIGVGSLFFPESPRWLLLKGREPEARKSFARFYGKAPDSVEVTSKVHTVLSYIELEKSNQADQRWNEILRGTNLRRTLTSTMIQVGVSCTGSRFLSTYTAVFLSAVGIGNPFLINVFTGICSFAGTLPSPLYLEFIGRRRTMLFGYCALGTYMLLISAVGTGLGQNSRVAQNTLIAFLCMWSFTYTGAVGTSLTTTAPELHALRCRTNGQAFAVTIYEIFSFASSFYTPYMISPSYGNMGLNVGYFFCGLSAIMAVLVYFFVPETGRLTLEQIDDMFIAGEKAWNTSLKKNKLRAA